MIRYECLEMLLLAARTSEMGKRNGRQQSSQARSQNRQHAAYRLLRSRRPKRRRSDHGAPRLRLHRPHLLEGLQRHRRARSEKAARSSNSSPLRRTHGPFICRPSTICSSSSTTRTCSRNRSRRREAILQGIGGSARPSQGSEARLVGRVLRSTTSRSPTSRSRSASCRLKARACTGSGMSADAGLTPRRCSTASPTTS